MFLLSLKRKETHKLSKVAAAKFFLPSGLTYWYNLLVVQLASMNVFYSMR